MLGKYISLKENLFHITLKPIQIFWKLSKIISYFRLIIFKERIHAGSFQLLMRCVNAYLLSSWAWEWTIFHCCISETHSFNSQSPLRYLNPPRSSDKLCLSQPSTLLNLPKIQNTNALSFPQSTVLGWKESSFWFSTVGKTTSKTTEN